MKWGIGQDCWFHQYPARVVRQSMSNQGQIVFVQEVDPRTNTVISGSREMWSHGESSNLREREWSPPEEDEEPEQEE